ncbi:MAG: cyclase family protein, partial [Acidobacteria bacterium]|nr:cyclase family protein [Acidobacteriota bacterium]
YLEPGEWITVADLEAWEAQAGVRVGPGDAFLLRWGRWVRQDDIGSFDTGAEAAGLDNRVIPWLRERDVAIIGWETPGYMPQPPGDLPRLALHDFALTMLGVHLLDRADFDDLAEAAAERNRWEFMLNIAPLPIPNGTASPVNPIAIF